jgi:Uma2 family endonuclease
MNPPGEDGTPDRTARSREARTSLAWVTVRHDGDPDVSVLYEVNDEGVPVRDRWLEVDASVVVTVEEMR